MAGYITGLWSSEVKLLLSIFEHCYFQKQVLLKARLHGCQRAGTSAEPGVLNEKDLVKAEGGMGERGRCSSNARNWM